MKNQKSKNISRSLMIIFSLLLAVVLGGMVFDSVLAVSGGAAGLIPCGNTSDPNSRCTLCHLVLGFKGIIDYGFNIFIFLALLMLVVAGVMYIISTGDQGLMTTAKGIFMNTLFGFAFVLLAWLLVNFTIYMLGAKVGLSQNPDAKWNEFKCDDVPSAMPGINPNPSRDSRTNCNGVITVNSRPCDSDNPSVSTPIKLVQSCPAEKSCYYECNPGYTLDWEECVK